MRRWLYLLAALGLLLLWFWPSGLPSMQPPTVPTVGLGRPSPEGGGRRSAIGGPQSELPPAKPVGAENALLFGNAAQVTRGATITFEGHGYQPGEAMVLYLEGSNTKVGQTVANEHGSFYGMGYGVAEELANGEHVVVAVGVESGRTGRARFVLRANPPYMKLSQETAKPGQAVVAEGGGFDPGEEVRLYLDSVAGRPLATAQAGPYGQLDSTELRVPSTPAGDHFLVAVGAESRFPVRAPLYVIGFSPWIEMTHYTPQAESRFGFIGNDFAPGEQVWVYLDQQDGGPLTGQPQVVVRANDQGKVEAPDALKLPATLVGEHTLVVVGAQTQQPTTAEFELMPFGPGLELTRYAGRVGTELGFIGSHFAPNETLRAYIGTPDSGREVSTFQADDQGTFEEAGRFVLPTDLRAGDVALTVVGERSLAPTSVTFTVLPLEPGLELSQRYGQGGEEVSLTGWGFAAHEIVRIYQGASTERPIAESQTDENGNFADAGPYRVPDDTEGELSFVAEGERSRGRAEVVFTVRAPLEAPGEQLDELPGQAGRQPPAEEPNRSSEEVNE